MSLNPFELNLLLTKEQNTHGTDNVIYEHQDEQQSTKLSKIFQIELNSKRCIFFQHTFYGGTFVYNLHALVSLLDSIGLVYYVLNS